jgi:hypothetical protein
VCIPGKIGFSNRFPTWEKALKQALLWLSCG